MRLKFVLLLLLMSVAIRCIGLPRPLLDAHNIRQVHTAILTKNLMEDGYPWLKTRGDWKGFEDSNVLLELPVHMHLATRLATLTSSVEAGGRLTSIAFLRFCWQCGQLFGPTGAPWAAAIFAFSPLGIFFGQSFQPETLMLSLSLIMLGLTLKSNEIAHLAVPVLILGWARKGGQFLQWWQV